MELACSQERGIFLRTSSSRSFQERKQVVTMDSGLRAMGGNIVAYAGNYAKY